MSLLPWYVPEEIKREIRHFTPFLKSLVREAMDQISKDPKSGKTLEDELSGLRSYRIGKYRLVYRIETDRLNLSAVGSRRDIYERIILEIGREKIKERVAKYRGQSTTFGQASACRTRFVNQYRPSK